MAIWGLARSRTLAASFAALGICCGARSELDVSPGAADASEAGRDASPPSLAPCTARDYASDLNSDVFAVTSHFVYFVFEAAGLYRTPKDAGEPQLVFEFSGSDYIDDFVADESFVWWVDAGGYLARIPSAGGSKETLGCAVPTGCPTGAGLYVTLLASTPTGVLVSDNSARLYVVPTDGSALFPLSASAVYGPVRSVATDDAVALWSTDERVYGNKLDGTDQGPVAYADWPGAVALHGGFMYWTRKVSGAWRLERRLEGSDEPASKLADGISGPIGANDAFVYGGIPNGGGLAKAPVSGGATSILVPYVGVRRVVVDGACVYYVSGKGLHRVPG